MVWLRAAPWKFLPRTDCIESAGSHVAPAMPQID
jgi:hypothetical protein